MSPRRTPGGQRQPVLLAMTSAKARHAAPALLLVALFLVYAATDVNVAATVAALLVALGGGAVVYLALDQRLLVTREVAAVTSRFSSRVIPLTDVARATLGPATGLIGPITGAHTLELTLGDGGRVRLSTPRRGGLVVWDGERTNADLPIERVADLITALVARAARPAPTVSNGHGSPWWDEVGTGSGGA